MGCKQSLAGRPPLAESATLPAPVDDILPWVCGLEEGPGDSRFAASGIDGTVYIYDWNPPKLASSFRAHTKAVNRLLPLGGGRLLSASADATVRLWRLGSNGMPASGSEGVSSSMWEAPEPELSLKGHLMSVTAMDVPGGGGFGDASVLFTGSRDCTVRLWDLATGTQLLQQKILRNVVTAARNVPGGAPVIVQASEDLQLRIWDTRAGLKPVEAKVAGPNQLICLDVCDDGRYVACGSKGFSRENCEVKVFDLRAGLRELGSAPCADHSIEALRMGGPDRCIIASKDCCIRSIDLPDPRVLKELSPGPAAYTALGVLRRGPTEGPLVLAAGQASGSATLELWNWEDPKLLQQPSLLATTG